MKTLMAKMKEYLVMDTEIPFKEFSDYYRQVMDHLQMNYDDMDNDNLLNAKFIVTIINGNSMSRAQRKGTESKKYKKMGEKAKFWSEAINFRLIKSGFTQEAIDEQMDKMMEDAH